MAQSPGSEPARLILSGQPHAVERAELRIERAARWPRRKEDDAGVGFTLAVHVDEDSGEDGAPSPMIQNLPVREAFGRWPRLDELPGLVLTLDDDTVWDAWYGNDAPPLRRNRLAFGSWSGRHIGVDWTAQWERGHNEPGTLVFQGGVALDAIRLHIFEDESIEALVMRIWGADALVHFDIARVARPPLRIAGWDPPAGMPDTVTYDLWPAFLGPRVS